MALKYVIGADMPPVTGAVIWAFNTLNNSGAMFYDKVRAQLRDKI